MRSLAPSISGFLAYYKRNSLLRHLPNPHLLLHLPRQFAAKSGLTMPSIENVPYFEYQPIEGVERLERYRPGGYHPIHIGDVLKGRYRVVHKLGHGAYSTIWLSRDEHQAVYVAVKISTGDSSPHEADILCAIANSPGVDDPGRSIIPIIQDRFEIQGPNGCHKCYVTPPAQSSVAAASFSHLFKIETARALVAELVLAVAYIHAQGIVHGGKPVGWEFVWFSVP